MYIDGSKINTEHLATATGSDTSYLAGTYIHANLLQTHSSLLLTSKHRGRAIIVF